MRILFLLQELPYPADNGHRQKVFNLLNHIVQHHDCDVLALGSAADRKRCSPWLNAHPRLHLLGVFGAEQLRFLVVKQAWGLISGNPVHASLRYRSPELVRALRHALNTGRYDVVHVDLISMAFYCQELGVNRRVLSLNDSLSLTQFGRARNQFASFWFRARSLLQGLLQREIDRKLFCLADAVHFVGTYDAEWSRKNLAATNAVYIPLAVNPDCLRLNPKRNEERARTVLIVDKLWADQHRVAVERFLAEHWQRIRQKHGDARLIVIGGKGMPEAFCAFIRSIPETELYERVDRLEDVLERASIAVFPYSVEVGMKTRVLECMAAMMAVVATPNGFLGLPVSRNVEAVIADDHAAMANAIDELLARPQETIAMGVRARRFIVDHFTQSQVGSAWEQLYGDVADGRPVRHSYGVEGAGVTV